MLAAVVLVSGLGVVSCSSKRWCEQDATDTVVSDSYCEKNTPGYEWESGSKKKMKHKKQKSKRKSK
ncbi:hypothetical protein GCM10010191_68860 [Actinomadura vinacea]|uniref:Lipoprotein n=1 Tax=Actinomadura vinacea TaxID=115336 RepID=A0ABP5X1R3_9ACTN